MKRWRRDVRDAGCRRHPFECTSTDLFCSFNSNALKVCACWLSRIPSAPQNMASQSTTSASNTRPNLPAKLLLPTNSAKRGHVTGRGEASVAWHTAHGTRHTAHGTRTRTRARAAMKSVCYTSSGSTAIYASGLVGLPAAAQPTTWIFVSCILCSPPTCCRCIKSVRVKRLSSIFTECSAACPAAAVASLSRR